MRRVIRAGLLLLVGAGCETAGQGERAETHQQELFKVNRGLASDSQVTPLTARERDDPLLIPPATWLTQEPPEPPRRP